MTEEEKQLEEFKREQELADITEELEEERRYGESSFFNWKGGSLKHPLK